MAAGKDIIDIIQLINSANVGPITFYKLLETYGSAANALNALPGKCKPFPRHLAEREAELAQKLNISLITFADNNYPMQLRNIEDAPPLLYVKGNIDCLNSPMSLSVVGARNASLPGRKLASQIAHTLTENGVMIVSGMARGIDAAAHKGAMYACGQSGATIAVLGTGADIPYPAENKTLYEQIAAQGAIISELPLGTEPSANNFPRRNRIVSALSQGTLVVEASLHSGSLITARLALEQGRDVYAIPGFPADGRSAGPNKLIKDVAYLVENAEDILNLMQQAQSRQIRPIQRPVQKELFLPPLDNQPKTADIPEAALSTGEINIIDFLTPGGVYVDEIIRESGLDSAAVSLQILELEMDGRITRLAGNKIALIK